jgi:predicted transcriptional regulator
MAKSKYTEDMDTIALSMARLGATDKEIAEALGVTEQTLNNWKRDKEGNDTSFFESLKKGKLFSDAEVADKLFQRATGYKWIDHQAIKCKHSYYDDRGKKVEDEEVVIVEVPKEMPPDVTAQIFWLKNRSPVNWRDKQEVSLSGGDVPISVKQVIDEVKAEVNERK